MRRRDLLLGLGAGLLGLTQRVASGSTRKPGVADAPSSVRLLLCGDVMTGRGIDQVLPKPCDPSLHEPYVDDARTYVDLAERANGRIEKPVGFSYVWGDALLELERRAPHATVVNLETAVTKGGVPWPRKGIHYRMSPEHVGVLTAAGIDCCALANNHVLDWGIDGLHESLQTLQRAGIATAGAGRKMQHAKEPAVLEIGAGRRVLVFSFGTLSSGIPRAWRASSVQPGLWLLRDLSADTVDRIGAIVAENRRDGDVVVASIHLGGNWGYEIPSRHRTFARQLVDRASVNVVHGHSSHHPRGIEVHRNRPILYGCGDFLNDYEGISGHEEYRSELTLGYWLDVDPASGELVELRMTPFRIRRFRLERAPIEDARWLAETLDREGRSLGTRVECAPDGELVLQWSGAGKIDSRPAPAPEEPTSAETG